MGELESIKKFLRNEEENIGGLELKKSGNDFAIVTFGDGLDIKIHFSSGVVTSIDSEGLEDLGEAVKSFLKTNTKANVSMVLQEITKAFLADDDDEVLDDESDGTEEEDPETPFDEDLMEDDIFEKIDTKAKKNSSEKADFEKLEALKKKFNITGTTKQAVSRLLKDILALDPIKTNELGFSAYPKDKNIFEWEVKMFNFEKDNPKAPLTKDLQKYKKQYGEDCLTFSVTFPQEYPFAPPFIRLVSPRFQFRTGHITIGGSICFQLLTKSGWIPASSIESIFVQIRLSLVSGGGRLDFGNRSPYSLNEAKQAFFRVAKRYGWE